MLEGSLERKSVVPMRWKVNKQLCLMRTIRLQVMWSQRDPRLQRLKDCKGWNDFIESLLGR